MLTDAGGFCCRLHPHCTGGLDANRAIPDERHHHTRGHAGGQCGSMLAAQCMAPSRAAPGGPAVPPAGARVRCAGARSPSPRRSSGTAVWGVRSMVVAPMAACPPGRAPSRWFASPCARVPAAGGVGSWDGANQSCVSAETVWARRIATPASVIRRALSSLRVSGRANILGAYVDGRSQRRSGSGQGLHTSPCMENA